MSFSLRQSLQSLMGLGHQDKTAEQEPEVQQEEEFYDLDFEKEASTREWSFQPKELPKHEEFGKPITMPNDNQSKLWVVYKFGGRIDLKKGDGPRYYEPGHPEVRGMLMGEFTGMMHEATKRAIGRGSASPGEVNKFHRNKAYRAFERYDPVKFAKPHGDTGQVRAPLLSSYVWNSMMPKQMGGGASGQRVVAGISGTKALTEKAYSDLAKARPIMNEFKLRHNREISAMELAQKMIITKADAERILKDGAAEFDPADTIDDKNTATERMLPLKDAIMSVYISSDETEKRILEWLWYDYLTPKIPIPDHAKTLGGRVKQKWMAEQLGIGDHQVTRIKQPLVRRIEQNEALLSQM